VTDWNIEGQDFGGNDLMNSFTNGSTIFSMGLYGLTGIQSNRFQKL
jgi:hypothetical protein